MKLSLVICTYMRPLALKKILISINEQILKPDEVIIVDGSLNPDSKIMVEELGISWNYKYYLVDVAFRGLTLQRNFGVSKVDPQSDLISFLDDDLVLKPDYFEKIISTFKNYKTAIGVGGIDLVENRYFEKKAGIKYSSLKYYELDGWVIKEPLRFRIRKFLGLMSSLPPGIVPFFGHGRSSFPPNGKIYPVEYFMGGIATYRSSLFKDISFSEYFKGYGLYEDFDFCVRSLDFGKLYVNTGAQVYHYHEPSGRPNYLKLGKMIVRNGWYVWKLRYPSVSILNRLKWHFTFLILAHLRLLNFLIGPDRKNSIMEYFGRMVGWVSLFVNSPNVIYNRKVVK